MDTVKIKLQGHEKFFPRDGWLNKGMDSILENPKIFTDKHATDVLGVGTNMVKSIRYWVKAFGVVEEKQNKGASLTKTGEIIKKSDPYFEDMFTLWVLHSNLVKNAELATVWYLFFNNCDFNEIEKNDLEQEIRKELIKFKGDDNFSNNSLHSDIDVLLNMYRKHKQDDDPEDKNYSPLSKLNLVAQEKNIIIKKAPDLQTISEWNVLYEIAELMESQDNFSIDRIIEGEMGLSKIYNLSRVSANHFLDRLDDMGYIKVDRTAGLDMIYKSKEFNSDDILIKYYSSKQENN